MNDSKKNQDGSTSAEHQFQVAVEEAGLRLDRLLQARFPIISRERWQQRIKAGRVLVDGRPVRPGRRVQAESSIWFEFLRKPEPPINTDYQIVYGADFKDRFYVINKPPDLPVHAAGVYYHNTLLELLRQDTEGRAPLFPVHRLDRETSGLLLLACDSRAARQLQALFQAGQIIKEYKVIVEGRFPEMFDARGYLGPHPDSIVRKKMHFINKNDQPRSDYKTCRTEFQLLHNWQAIDGADLSLLSAHLHTGRMHQIRATLCSLGYPVVGDRLYGVDESLYLKFINDQESPEDMRRLRMDRTALHSSGLSFQHPFKNELMQFLCDLPADMRALINLS